MSAQFNGSCDYVNTIGSRLEDRTAFDGSVPYTITTAASLQGINLSGTSQTAVVFFSLNGVAGHYTITGGNVPDDMKSALTRQCGIRLRDIYVMFPDVTRGFVDIYVGDPTASPPETTVAHTHLFYGHVPIGGGMFRIPDIEGLVVAPTLNVMVKISMTWSGANKEVVFHSVCDIDD